MDTVRAFLAVLPPQSMQDHFTYLLDNLKRCFPDPSIKWVELVDLHVTLQFLPAVQLDHIKLLIQGVQSKFRFLNTFQLEFNNPEWFPQQEHPKFLSLSVGPQDVLKEMSAILGGVINDLGYGVETRPYRGHMTLARLGQFRPEPALLQLSTLPVIPSVTINELYLIESKPDKGKANYRPLAVFNLG